MVKRLKCLDLTGAEVVIKRGDFVDCTSRIMRWIKTKGAVVFENEAAKQNMAEYIAPVGAVFPDLAKKLCCIYVYKTVEQKRDARDTDGICWRDETNDVGTLFAIGISTDTLDAGPEYTAFVFLHELCHMVTNTDHTVAFHEELDRMIRVYNQATGAELENDYFDIPSRFDCRPYEISGRIRKM